MAQKFETLLDGLVQDLRPVRRLSLSGGLGVVAGGLAVSLAAVVLLTGLRSDVAAGGFDPLFLLTSGVFLILGLACAVTVIVMSRPQVGNSHGGWVWAAAMAALLPLTALVTGLGGGTGAALNHGASCLLAGTALALVTGGALTLWLRRGAPTSPERAGLLTGIAAGSLGIFAWSFHCPDSSIMHVGLWHSAVVLVSALAGRALVPALIRW